MVFYFTKPYTNVMRGVSDDFNQWALLSPHYDYDRLMLTKVQCYVRQCQEIPTEAQLCRNINKSQINKERARSWWQTYGATSQYKIIGDWDA